jgi:peptidoglycan/LPS O-acetylase OafA/YrhL
MRDGESILLSNDHASKPSEERAASEGQPASASGNQSRFSSRQREIKVDMTAHIGMRGFLTVWIVVFHSILYSDLSYINLQGSAWMTMFFLLSGFSLGVIYLDKCGSEHSRSCCSWAIFYQNRLARILPTFYFCNCLAVPLVWLGWSEIQRDAVYSSVAMTVVPIYTWLAFALGSAFDGPGWTVSTLLFFYLLFPFLGRAVESRGGNDFRSVARALVGYYLLQTFIAFLLLMTTGSFIGNGNCSFRTNTCKHKSRGPHIALSPVLGSLHLQLLQCTHCRVSPCLSWECTLPTTASG